MTYPAHVLRVAKLIQALGNVLPWDSLSLALDIARPRNQWDGPKADDFSGRELGFAREIAGCARDDAMKLIEDATDANLVAARKSLALSRELLERASRLEYGASKYSNLANRAADIEEEATKLEAWMDRAIPDHERCRVPEAR